MISVGLSSTCPPQILPLNLTARNHTVRSTGQTKEDYQSQIECLNYNAAFILFQ